MQKILRRVCGGIWVGCVVLVAICVFNYPRIWWQEVLNCLSLVWTPLFLVSIFIHIKRLFRGPIAFPVIACLVLEVACVATTASIVWPYISYAKKASATLAYSEPFSVLFVDQDSAPDVNAPSKSLPHGDIVVALRGVNSARLRAENEGELTYKAISAAGNSRVVEVCSKFPFIAPPKPDAGYAALPAVYGAVSIAEGATLEIGAFDLIPSVSQETFVASRLTSRRVASILRFSSQPRMVFGGFRAPITSQIVQMYPGQVRLNSVLFNLGISGLWRRLGESFSWTSALNVFVAKNIMVEQVVEHTYERDGWRGVSFVARVALVKN